MKTKELSGIELSESLLGGDSSRYDVVRAEDGRYEAYLKSSDSESPVAWLNVDDGVIVELKADEEESSHKSDIFTAMIKAVCRDADKSNVPLVVPVDALLDGIKAVRFMQSFGFTKNDEYLERRPGAALPFTVLF